LISLIIFVETLNIKQDNMNNSIQGKGEILLYTTPDGQTKIDVTLVNDTVWLTQAQMSDLFQKDQSVIARHISNLFKEGELEKESNMQILHNTLSKYKPTSIYNLEVIISVGYRVKSKRGIDFRIWARGVLKDFLIKGYAVNERMRREQIAELRQLVGMLGRTIQNQPLISTDETNALFEVVTDYTYALDTLDNYDYQRLTISQTTQEERFHATYENAMEEIVKLRNRFGGSTLFGNEKDDSFKSSIGQIYQTFGGEELYPSVEEKAAMLLYLVTKNHSFSDGNKRIAATLFLWFLNENRILYRPDGSKRLPDNTLVALTLMIAESRPEEKDIMVKVVVNLINQNN
jgi:prophage maintenance system killer protein